MLMQNALFTLSEIKGKCFVYRTQPSDAVSPTDLRLLLHSLKMICEGPQPVNSVILDIHGLKSKAVRKSFFKTYKSEISQFKNTGIRSFAIIAQSLWIRAAVTAISVLTQSSHKVKCYNTIQDAVVAHEKKILHATK